MQAFVAGTQKHFPNGSFTLGKTAYTTADLVQAFQGHAGALAVVSAAHANLRDALTALRASEAKVAPLRRAFTSFLRATFSQGAAELGDFGLQPPKARAPLDVGKRVLATARAKATRKARGTLGPKQKLAVKGDVTGVVITPVTHAPK